jgi:hypothetical protein
MKSKKQIMLILSKVFLLFILWFIVSCGSPNKTGELVGVKVSIGFDDFADGVINKADFGGIVIVKLEDGTEVNAIWDKKFGEEFMGGMKLEIEPTKDANYWKVIRIIETPSGK